MIFSRSLSALNVFCAKSLWRFGSLDHLGYGVHGSKIRQPWAHIESLIILTMQFSTCQVSLDFWWFLSSVGLAIGTVPTPTCPLYSQIHLLQNDPAPGLEILMKTGKPSKKNGGCDASQTSVGWIAVPGRHFLAQVESQSCVYFIKFQWPPFIGFRTYQKGFSPYDWSKNVQELVSGQRHGIVLITLVWQIVSEDTLQPVHWYYPCVSADDYTSSSPMTGDFPSCSSLIGAVGDRKSLGQSSLSGGLTCLLTHILWDRCCHFVWLLGTGSHREMNIELFKYAATLVVGKSILWANMWKLYTMLFIIYSI